MNSKTNEANCLQKTFKLLDIIELRCWTCFYRIKEVGEQIQGERVTDLGSEFFWSFEVGNLVRQALGCH